MTPSLVYILRAHRPPCVLRAATPGDRITTLCADCLPYAAVVITTREPQDICPACRTELAAGTPGAAVAIEPQRPTIELRRRMTNEWGDG